MAIAADGTPAVPAGMATGAVVDAGGARRGGHRLLHGGLVEVVEDKAPRRALSARAGRREGVLPGEAGGGAGELEAQSVGQVDLAAPVLGPPGRGRLQWAGAPPRRHP
jgi:hypothetical protein